MLTKSNLYSEKQVINVNIPWHLDKKDLSGAVYSWNEICAWAIDQFGLPGGRFRFNPKNDVMEFTFFDEKDAMLMILRWL